MNYITTNHRGGIGNVMFKLAASVSLAMDNKVEHIFSKEFIRPIDPDYPTYYSNILRGFKFIENLPPKYHIYNEPKFSYTDIPYIEGTNLLLDGYFQSENYFIRNKETIINLFKPTNEIKESIIKDIPGIQNYISIHVRRGDFLNYPNHHPQQSLEYYKKAIDNFGVDRTYIIFSDDLEGVKDMFNFLPNKIFYTSSQDWLDLYIMSLCEHNIICNSTFSWWGAYLNENPNKVVIAPKKWFGLAYTHYDTSTLIPKDWLILNE